MSYTSPPPNVTNGGKQTTFGSIFAACNAQLEHNFLENDKTNSKVSFDSNDLKSSMKTHQANFFQTLHPTFNSTSVQGLIDLASNRNSLKTDKTICWGKDGLQPLNHLVGYTQCSLRVKDAALSKVFSGEMDISKQAYPDTSNQTIREVEILFLQNQVQKLKEARYQELIAEKSDQSFENFEFWSSKDLLQRINRERYAAFNPTQLALLGGVGQRAELVSTWTCDSRDFTFRQPSQIYDAPEDSVTLAEKMDYISRRGIDKTIVTHPKLPYSTVIGDMVAAEFASHKLTNNSSDAAILLTKNFFNLTFDSQKESTTLLAKQQDTQKQVKLMRTDAEALIRNSIKPSLLDDDDHDRLQRFEFKDFLTKVLSKQLGQHEIKKNLMEPIIDSFIYDEVRSTAFDLKSFFKSLTHLIGMDILTRIYKSTKFSVSRTQFRDFHELLSSIPMSDAEYTLNFNSVAADRAIPRTHSAADFKDIFINSVKDSALHDKALELEKKRDTMSLDEIRLALRDTMKDLKDKTADKCESSVIHTEREVRLLSSRLLTLEGGHTARSMNSALGGGGSTSGNSQSSRQPSRDRQDQRLDRARSNSTERSHFSRNPPSRDSSRGRPPSTLTRSEFISQRGYPSDSEYSRQSRASRDSRSASAGRDSNRSRGQQSGGGRPTLPRYQNEAKERDTPRYNRGNEHDRSRSRDRDPAAERRNSDQGRGRSPAWNDRNQRQPEPRQTRGNSPFPYRQPNNSTAERNPNAQPRGYRPTRGRDHAQASPRVSFHTQNEDRRRDRDPPPRPYDPTRPNRFDGGGRTARRDYPYGNSGGQQRDNRGARRN